MNEPKYLIVPFDHQYLVENPVQLSVLAKFYCSIWEIDENFGEYRQCPNCHRYYNYQQVVHQGINSCSDCKLPLDLAWEPAKVAMDLLETSNQTKNRFSGLLAFDPNGNIVGFAWAKILSSLEISTSWGNQISGQLQQINTTPEVAYFNELAVSPSMRGHNIGKNMVRIICQWMKDNHGEKMALLRTHEASTARWIYGKTGYTIFATDSMYGYGRIMMMANPCSSLTISNLI